MTISATNELGKHPCKEGLNGVVGKSTTKSTSLQWAYGKHPKIMRLQPATNGNNCLLENNEEMKNLFHREGYGESLDQ